MGIFGDLDFDTVSDSLDPEPGTYNCIISKAEVKPTTRGDKTGLGITYTIQDEGKWMGNTVYEWKEVPEDPASKAATYLKIRLTNLGLTPHEMNTFDKDELSEALTGKEVVIEVSQNTKDGVTYTNVQRVAEA